MKKIILLMVFLFVLVNISYGIEIDLKTNESTIDSFYLLKEETIDMADSGIPVIRIFNLVNQGEGILDSGDYNRLKEISSQIYNLTNTANELFDGLNQTNIKLIQLKEAGYNLSFEEEQYNLSRQELNSENYEQSEIHFLNITSYIDSIIINESIKLNDNLKDFSIIANDEKIESTLFFTLVQNFKKAQNNQDYVYIISIKNELRKINESVEVFVEINEIIESLDNKGRSFSRFQDLKDEGTIDLNERNYENILLLREEVIYLYDTYNRTEDLIQKLDQKLSELDFIEDLSDINKSIISSKSLFDVENYEEALEIAEQTYDLLIRLESQSLLFGAISIKKVRFNIINYFKENIWAIPIIILNLLILYLLFRTLGRIILIRIFKKNISSLESQEKVIHSLIKRNQVEYYVKQLFDKETYQAALHKYQEKLIKINEKIPVYHDRIKRLSKK